jgi:hypothetical protein
MQQSIREGGDGKQGVERQIDDDKDINNVVTRCTINWMTCSLMHSRVDGGGNCQDRYYLFEELKDRHCRSKASPILWLVGLWFRLL